MDKRKQILMLIFAWLFAICNAVGWVILLKQIL